MRVFFADRVNVEVISSGLGTLSLGSPVEGYQTPLQAGVPDGATVRYVIENIKNWELGWGVYSAGTLTRNFQQSSTGGLLDVSGAANVFFTAAAEDIVQPTDLQEALLEYLALAGGTMTGVLVLAGDPANDLEAATKQYVDKRLLLTGGTLTGFLTLHANPTNTLHASTKGYVDTQVGTKLSQTQADALYLSLLGGTLTGPLILGGDPVEDLEAATKGYVDTEIAGIGFPPGTAVGDAPPANPEQGQLWYRTADPVGLFIWYEDADSGQWVQVSGGDGTASSELELIKAGSGWTVVGDTLIQWGIATGLSSGVRTVTFPKEFKTANPTVTLSSTELSPDTPRFAGGNLPNTTSFGFQSWTVSGSQSAASAAWVAVGEALDADKMPKSIQLAAGVAAFASDAEARAGTVADKVMSPALVQARNGLIRGVVVGQTGVDFGPLPVEMTEFDLLFAHFNTPANGTVSLAFTPAARAWSTRAFMNAATISVAGNDDNSTIPLYSMPGVAWAGGKISFAKLADRDWTFEGSLRHTTGQMSAFAGQMEITTDELQHVHVQCSAALLGGSVSLRWRI